MQSLKRKSTDDSIEPSQYWKYSEILLTMNRASSIFRRCSNFLIKILTGLKNFCVDYWDVVVSLLAVVCLLKLHSLNELFATAKSKNPWQWPTYQDWSLEEELFLLNQKAQASTEISRTSSLEVLNRQNAFKARYTNSKIILFNQPAFGEFFEFPINPLKCGLCNVTYDKKLYHRAAAIVYQASDSNIIRKRR